MNNEHEPINILKALEDDAPSIIIALDKQINKLTDELLEIISLKAEYELHDLLRRKLSTFPHRPDGA